MKRAWLCQLFSADTYSGAAGSAGILAAACVARNVEADKISALPAVQCFLCTGQMDSIFGLERNCATTRFS